MKNKQLSFFLLLWLLLGTACNKEVDIVPLPPFSIYPNPFTGSFTLMVDPSISSQEDISFRVLNGKDAEVAGIQEISPGNNIQINMSNQEKAMYYAELKVGRQLYVQPIIKYE